MARIDPVDLAVFLAIARQGSFRRAASELGVTPSALSHSLRLVEERIGIRLINRTTRSLALTDAGARLFARIDPAFLDINDAIDELMG
jgi:DNA-binding transcriptional LysR family regulator